MNLFETVSGSIRFGSDRREIVLLHPQGRLFASDFPHEIAMEDASHEINEILQQKDINDKVMTLRENAKRFYNLLCEILTVAMKMRAE